MSKPTVNGWREQHGIKRLDPQKQARARILYPEKNHLELGEYYTRHVAGMTAAGLHGKADIAAQLAWRDRYIDVLNLLLDDGEAALSAAGVPVVLNDGTVLGVLHSYTSGWTGPEPTDPPVAGAATFVRELVDSRHKVTIMSTRAASMAGLRGMKRWLARHGFPVDRIEISSKKIPADLYVDDRGFRFEGDFDAVRAMVDSGARTWVDRKPSRIEVKENSTETEPNPPLSPSRVTDPQ